MHENFTDVDGVYSTDPRLCPSAKSMPNLSYAQTHALALAGAGVPWAHVIEAVALCDRGCHPMCMQARACCTRTR